MQSHVGHLKDYGLDPTHKEALRRNVKPRNCLIGIVFGKNHCLQWGKQIRGAKVEISPICCSQCNYVYPASDVPSVIERLPRQSCD